MKATFDARGELLIVTGGASGIGAGAAAGFVAAGGNCVVFDIAEPAMPAPGVDYVAVDVSDRAAVFTAVKEVRSRFGRIDGLIAAAAVQPRVDVIDTPEAMWRRTIGVNLDGAVWCCQAVLPSMIGARRGSIVLFASGLANAGRAQAAAYTASKAATIAYAKSLAAEVSSYRVRVNTIFPGVIDTPQFRAANPPGGEREHWIGTTGIGRVADVVDPLLFLLSESATMTGSTLTRERAYPRSENDDGLTD